MSYLMHFLYVDTVTFVSTVMQKEYDAVFTWCISPYYIIELVCDVITLKMDALSKRHDQSPVFGEDTDVIYFALLRFENPVRLYSTFFAVFTAECGFAVISFLSVSLVERR